MVRGVGIQIDGAPGLFTVLVLGLATVMSCAPADPGAKPSAGTSEVGAAEPANALADSAAKPREAAPAPGAADQEALVEPPALPPNPRPALPQPSAAQAKAPPEAAPTVQSLRKEEKDVARQLIKDFPNHADPLGLMGDVCSRQGSNDEAVRYWQQALDLDPKRPSTYNALATVAFLRQEYDRAVELYRKALSVDPKLPGARCRIGESLIALGKPDEAIRELTAELAQAPQHGQASFLLGRACYVSGDYQRAKQCFEAAIQADADNPGPYHQLSLVCARLQQPDQAAHYRQEFLNRRKQERGQEQTWRHDYDDLALVREGVIRTCCDAGALYAHQNQPEKAEALWLRAVALDPAQVAPRAALAALGEQTGRLDEAIAHYEQICAQTPTDATAWAKLGTLQVRMKRLAAGEEALRKACELAPNNPKPLRLLAQVLLESRRDPGLALTLARKAVELEPIAENYYVLGIAEAANGNRQEALSAVGRALELAPDTMKYKTTFNAMKSRL